MQSFYLYIIWMGSCGDSRPNLSLYSFKLCMSLVVFFCQIVSTAFPRSRMQQGVTVRGTSLWMSKNKPIFLSRCPMKSSHCFLTLFRTTRRLNKKQTKKQFLIWIILWWLYSSGLNIHVDSVLYHFMGKKRL